MGAASFSGKPQSKSSFVFASPVSHSISPLEVTRLKFERVVRLTVVAIRNTFNHLEIMLKSPQNKLNQVVFANTFNTQLYPMLSLFRYYHALKLEDELIKIKQSVSVHLEYIESMASMLQSFSDPPDSLDDDTRLNESDEESDLQTLKFVEIVNCRSTLNECEKMIEKQNKRLIKLRHRDLLQLSPKDSESLIKYKKDKKNFIQIMEARISNDSLAPEPTQQQQQQPTDLFAPRFKHKKRAEVSKYISDISRSNLFLYTLYRQDEMHTCQQQQQIQPATYHHSHTHSEYPPPITKIKITTSVTCPTTTTFEWPTHWIALSDWRQFVFHLLTQFISETEAQLVSFSQASVISSDLIKSGFNGPRSSNLNKRLGANSNSQNSDRFMKAVLRAQNRASQLFGSGDDFLIGDGGWFEDDEFMKWLRLKIDNGVINIDSFCDWHGTACPEQVYSEVNGCLEMLLNSGSKELSKGINDVCLNKQYAAMMEVAIRMMEVCLFALNIVDFSFDQDDLDVGGRSATLLFMKTELRLSNFQKICKLADSNKLLIQLRRNKFKPLSYFKDCLDVLLNEKVYPQNGYSTESDLGFGLPDFLIAEAEQLLKEVANSNNRNLVVSKNYVLKFTNLIKDCICFGLQENFKEKLKSIIDIENLITMEEDYFELCYPLSERLEIRTPNLYELMCDQKCILNSVSETDYDSIDSQTLAYYKKMFIEYAFQHYGHGSKLPEPLIVFESKLDGIVSRMEWLIAIQCLKLILPNLVKDLEIKTYNNKQNETIKLSKLINYESLSKSYFEFLEKESNSALHAFTTKTHELLKDHLKSQLRRHLEQESGLEITDQNQVQSNIDSVFTIDKTAVVVSQITPNKQMLSKLLHDTVKKILELVIVHEESSGSGSVESNVATELELLKSRFGRDGGFVKNMMMQDVVKDFATLVMLVCELYFDVGLKSSYLEFREMA
ncbi:unnamed protein product [Ambrosiozyma monospora]|uniref:Unnamed protein product n=1 Tax=Ambrosiozyma monospora TaxID=43982 RepID=A0A9W6YYI8_AMBMO|nr:unnamed protein product [Ambrosiozyma monospora]